MSQSLAVNFVDMQQQFLTEREELQEVFNQAFLEGNFVNGNSIELLEQEIADYIGVKYVICVNSGTDALRFGMTALGIGEGDEVITPPNSFIASTSSIVHVGAVPVFADVLEDQNIDPEFVESVITSKTKAIMPVHLTGRVAEMHKLKTIADKHNLLLIEDAAQSFGSKYFDKYSGTLGDIGCFSTHPLKVFSTAGDGGFVTTNDLQIVERIKKLRNHGMQDRNTVVEWGYVSRMDTFQAEVLRFRLHKINSYITNRRKNVSIYRELLDNKNIFIPKCQDYEFNSFQTFVIQAQNRNNLQKYLKDNQIQTMIHYPVPIHLQPVAEYLGHRTGDFPMTEKLANTILTIPNHQYLSANEIAYVADKINKFY